MFVDVILIWKGIAIYGFAAGSILICDISSLYHKIRYNSVEYIPFIMQRLPTFSYTFLPRAQTPEILRGYGAIRV